MADRPESSNDSSTGGKDMDATETKKQIADYLSSHNIMTLAMVSPEGTPTVRTL